MNARRNFKIICKIFLSVFLLAFPLAAQPAIKIMPVGDSITYGYRSSQTTAYRRVLYQELTAAGWPIDFVGSLQDGDVSDFDRDHEGHPGFTTDMVRDNIYSWLEQQDGTDNRLPVNIVILHIGTNDINNYLLAPEVRTKFAQILDRIDLYEQDYGADIPVIVARIINRSDVLSNSARSLSTREFNQLLGELVGERRAAGDHVSVVDLENGAGINYHTDTTQPYTAGDMYDNLHPNDNGDRKMALKLFAAVDNKLSASPNPTVSGLSVSSTSGSGRTDDDLYSSYDLTGSSVTSATAWYLDGAPIMVLYLPMEGGPANAARDYSGNSNNAVENGGVIWNSGIGFDGSGAYDFDGNGELSAGETFPVLSSYTKTAWVFRTGSGNGGGNAIIAGNERVGGHMLWAPDSYGNKLSAGHNDKWNLVQDTSAIALNRWYFVAVSYDDASGQMTLYKDGIKVAQATVSTADRDVTDKTVSIGSFGLNNGQMWRGIIDDVRVYNQVLSPDQIRALYDGGLGDGDKIVAQQTSSGEKWQAYVTPFSESEAGETFASNITAIVAAAGGLVQEAEGGVRHGAFVIGSAAAASGGSYVWVPNGTGIRYDGPDPAHRVDYSFTVGQAGLYRIKGRVYAPNGDDDSFWVRVNGAPAGGYLWDVALNTSYQTDYVNDRNGADPVEVLLPAGVATVTVYLREDGARLDTIELEAVANAAPAAVDDAYSVSAGQSLVVGAAAGVLANDTDANGTPLEAVLMSGTSHGTLNFNEQDGSFTYVPVNAYTGLDKFTYRSSDGVLESNTATVTITVAAAGGLVQEAEGGVRHGAFVIGSAAAASGGSYVWVPNGTGIRYDGPDPAHRVDYSFTVGQAGLYRIKGRVYAPNGDDDSFWVRVNGAPAGGYLWDVALNTSYQTDYVNDRNGADPVEVLLPAGVATVTVYLREDGARLDTIELEAVANAAPAAVDDAYSVSAGQSLVVGAAAGVLANDTDANGTPLEAVLMSGTSHGTLNFNEQDGSFTYVPVNAYTGLDKFTYRSSDGVLESNTATVTITVAAAGGLVQEAEGGVRHGAFVIGSAAAASGGSYVWVPNGTGIRYDGPDPAHRVDYSFTVGQAGLYRIKGRVYAPNGDDDSFWVRVNGAPAGGYLWDVALNTSYQTDYVNDRNGADPVEVLLPAGVATVTVYLREDGARLDTIELEAVANAAPAAVDDAYSVSAGQSLVVGAAAGVLANDTDANGTPLEAVLMSGTSHGTLNFNEQDGSFTYVPVNAYTGLDKFTYRSSDGVLESNTATVTITVAAAGGLVQEAEGGVRHGAFVIGSAAAASGGSYVWVPNGTGIRYDGPDPAHRVDYSFTVGQAGLYRIKGRVYAPNGDDDSFWVRVNGAPAGGYLWDVALNTSYQTDYVNDRNGADPVEVLLPAGVATVTVYLREDGARLDTIELEAVGQ